MMHKPEMVVEEVVVPEGKVPESKHYIMNNSLKLKFNIIFISVFEKGHKASQRHMVWS
jgi:hypothetical protein